MKNNKEKKTGKMINNKTGMDVAEAVKCFIRSEYPEMSEDHALRLAMLLTKEGLKEEKSVRR